MRSPISTYRLQVTGEFTLHDAARLADYLRDLGADWFYLSPILQAVPGFVMRGIAVAPPPVSANVGATTGVFLQYTAPPDRDGHFVVFRVAEAQTQHAQFLGSLARDGVATLVAP